MINLTALPAPQIIEPLDYESILAARKQQLIDAASASSAELGASIAQVLMVESEPLTKQLEESAARELLLRQRINDAAAAMLLATATGSDLDHIAATYYEVERLLINPGDAAAIPPVAPVYESDDRLRSRCRLSLYGRSVAGPKNAYKYHAMSADAEVKDAHVAAHTPAPGDVTLTLLSATGDGTPAQTLLDSVLATLDAEQTRPLNDTVFVQPAQIINWVLDATLICYPEANTSLVLQLAYAAAAAFASDHHALDHDINIDAIHAALHVAGVQKVIVHAPAADLMVASNQAPFNAGITLAIAGSAV